MLAVSNYHYIREDFKTPYPSIFGLTPLAFRNQLLAIKARGEYVHPNDLLANPQTYLSSKKLFFLITFDDGLREQYKLAKPILDDLEIPALFFVNSINYIEKKVSQVHKIHILRSKIPPADFLQHIHQFNSGTATTLSLEERARALTHYNYDTLESAQIKYILNFKISLAQQTALINAIFSTYEDEKDIAQSLYMTTAQLQDLADQGLLGSHTHSHLPLGMLKERVICAEIKKTKDYLETLTKKAVPYISYPYGSLEACASPVATLAKEAGHHIGFTMQRAINTGVEDPLLLKRLDCNDLPLGKNSKAFDHAYRTIH